MENNILTEIIVAVRRSNRLLKRIVTIQNVFTNPLLLKHISVKMLITQFERNHNTIEDNGYTYWTESQAHYLYGGVPTLN